MRAFRLTLAAIATGISGAAAAQPIVVADSGDNGWMLAMSLIVLVAAVPGIAMLHARTRGEHTGLALFAAVAIMSLMFAIAGYSLAYSDGTGLLGGMSNLMLDNMPDIQPDLTISGSIFMLFELAIAIFAVSVVIGSVAERTRLGWLLAFATLWPVIVYVPVAHWVWGGGWLAGLGVIDYGGGIVVQTCAGVSVLVIALLLGQDRHAEPVEVPRLISGGAALMWIGWLALLGGSSFGATDDAGDAMINAQLAASAALIAGLAFEKMQSGRLTFQGAAMSVMGGLAAVSAGAGSIGPMGAIFIGVIGATGGAIAGALVRALKAGSASSAFVAHGGGAIAGAILFPVFVLPAFGGPGFDDGASLGNQLAIQGIAVVAVALWTAIGTAIAALMISMVLPMTGPND